MIDRVRQLAAGRPDQVTLEAIAWLAILALAAALRLPDLAGRGTWDADQGHDMLVLRRLVVDGSIPLLGPPTSIGAFHHGVLYYLLLAPAAFASGADPVAVTTWIALGGVVAVATAGWLARLVGGPWAGLIAGLVLAVSAGAVDESIFIWNPNLIALSSSIGLAAAWRAHQTGRVRWWVAAAVAAVVTMHCHVLGVILTPVIAALLVADWRRSRRPRSDAAATRLRWAALAWVAIALVSYVPLAVHELGTDGSELRAALAFVAGGGGSSSVALPVRLVIVLVRVLSWPLAGLLTNAPVAALVASAAVVGVVLWRGWLAPPDGTGDERLAVRWLGLGLAWTVLALTVAAPSLASVVPGLPNDHYHAFADPMVVVLMAIGAAALLQGRVVAGRAIAAVAVGGAVTFNLATQPPAVAADGGWRAAEAAARKVIQATGGGPLVLTSLPTFKSAEALRFPLESARLGAAVHEPTDPIRNASGGDRSLVIVCDQLFREAIGADCDGPAEDALAARLLATSPLRATLADRFEAAPGRWISTYGLEIRP